MYIRQFLSHYLQFCHGPKSLSLIHSLLLKNGLLTSPDCFFATKLASTYGKLTSSSDAIKLFDEIPKPSTFLFNAVLRAHSNSNQWYQSLLLFKQVSHPDSYTFPLALKASAHLLEFKHGKAIHGAIYKCPYAVDDMFLGSSLVEFYSKCNTMEDAVRVFEGFKEPDVVLWTSVVTGYEQNGCAEKAASFFSRMVTERSILPNPITLISLVGAIGHSGNIRAAKCCHGYVHRAMLSSNLALMNSILNLYSKLGLVHYMVRLFEMMEERDVITWSCMIASYVHNCKPNDALEVYKRMSGLGLIPNAATAVSVIQACALARNLEEGKRMHEFAVRKGFELDVAVSTSLIDMYMKCRCCNKAMELFLRVPKKDAVIWAAVIGGCSQNGLVKESFELFVSMLSTGEKPDAVTMVKVLSACSLNQAHCLHAYLVKSGFDHKTFVGAALIDVYSKSGSLNEAIKVFKRIRDKDVVVWSSMIAGYGIHGFGRESMKMFERMIELSVKPNNITFVSVLSACSHAGLVEQGRMLFDSMSEIYGVTPDLEHYGIMVDILARNGKLNDAMKLIEDVSGSVDPHMLCALLAGCRKHQNVEIGEVVGEKLINMEPNHAGYYNLLSNMYAFDGRWKNVEKLKGLMEEGGSRKYTGCSAVVCQV